MVVLLKNEIPEFMNNTRLYPNKNQSSKKKILLSKKLEDKVTEIQETFNNFKEKMFNFCDKICRALGHKIGLHFSKNYDIDYNEMEYYAQEVNRKYERPYEKKELDKSDDFEIGM